MEKEEVLAIAETINQQIGFTANIIVQLTWGVSKRLATIYKGMATLKLRVSGAIHKGWVYISLNQGTDTYEITLTDVHGNIKKELTDIYFDQLGTLIDSLVERPSDKTDDEYAKIAMADSKKKMCY